MARLDLVSGRLGTQGQVRVARNGRGITLAYTGRLAVEDVRVDEAGSGEPFLRARSIRTASLAWALDPAGVSLDELTLEGLDSRFIIFEDRTTSFGRVLKTAARTGHGADGGADPKQGQPAVSAGDAEAAAPGAPTGFEETNAAHRGLYPVEIGRVRVMDASLEFADLTLSPKFGARMHTLGGTLVGVSADPATVTQIELDGRVDDSGTARIRGALRPQQPGEQAEVKLAFRNIEMNRLTPYSGRFAGRRIESGTLTVDLDYTVKARQLAAQNRFVVNRIRLGERVDSPDARNLPLDLAIALLEDSNGVIDLDLPVTGSLDDPQFSYAHLIWKAIGNVLTRIATAPFRAIGRLLGGDSEKFEAMLFDPGSSRLLPPEESKLKTLSNALTQRPVLALTITPAFDPVTDRRVLQEQAIRAEAAKIAGRVLAAGELPGPVDVNLHVVQNWLEDRYKAVAGEADYEALRQRFRAEAQAAGRGTALTQSETVERLARRLKPRMEGAPSAFHTELLERLTRSIEVPDTHLTALAEARGRGIRDALVQQGLDSQRIRVATPVGRAAKDGLVATSMGLGTGRAEATAPAAP